MEIKIMKINKVIKFEMNNKGNVGYCRGCGDFFKKNDIIIHFEKLKIDKIDKIKICVHCYIDPLAKVLGWSELNALILKKMESKI